MSDNFIEQPVVTYIGDVFEGGLCYLCHLPYKSQQFCTLFCGHLTCWWCAAKLVEVQHTVKCPFCKSDKTGLTKHLVQYYLSTHENPHLKWSEQVSQLLSKIDMALEKNKPIAQCMAKLVHLLSRCDPQEWNSITNSEHITVAHIAAALGNLHILQQCPVEMLNVCTSWGSLPLHYAAQQGHADALKWTLEQVPHQKNATGQHHKTPLMYAAKHGHVECVKLLVEAKADMTNICIEGHTALDLAVGFGEFTCACIMVEAGADVKRPLPSGNSLLNSMLNSMFSRGVSAVGVKLIKLMITRGMNVNQRDFLGRTALVIVVQNYNDECQEIMESLIAAGADLNQGDCVGRTALILAALQGYTECLKLLIEAGADVNHKDCQGQRHTALDWAIKNEQHECIALLVQAGAQATVESDNQSASQ